LPDPGANTNQRITLDEQRYDAALVIGYDVGEGPGATLLAGPDRGMQYLGIRNGTFRST